MMGIMALLPRPNVPGVTLADMENPASDFLLTLDQLSPSAHYVVYLVRDDSFPAYRKVRDLTLRRGFLSGWEYLGRTEAITFEGMFARVKAE